MWDFLFILFLMIMNNGTHPLNFFWFPLTKYARKKSCWIYFVLTKLYLKSKLKTFLLFVHLQACFPNCTKVWLLNIAWQLRLNVVGYTCFYVSAILNVMKIWHIGKSEQVCFPSCWVIINFLLLVIWKVLVIKYIRKFQCLWTCVYNKCQNSPTDPGWLYQVEFLSLT